MKSNLRWSLNKSKCCYGRLFKLDKYGGIQDETGENIHLPRIECLMIHELVSGGLERMYGVVDYSFYKTLSEE